MAISKEKKLIKNTVIVGMGTIAAKAIVFLMAPLYSRWLSVEAYGSFDLITTYVSLLLPFCTLAINEALFRFLLDDEVEKEKKEIVSGSIVVILLGYACFFIIYFFLSLAIKQLEFNPLICIFLAAQIFYSFMSETTRGLKRLDLYAIFSFISAVAVAGLSSIFLLCFKMGLSGIILGYSIGYIIAGTGLFITARIYSYISVNEIRFCIIKKMMAYSWPLIPNTISWWVVNVSDRLIINNIIGLTANGIYAVANKIPSVVNILFSVFHVSWLQSASENINDNEYEIYCNTVFNRMLIFLSSVVMLLVSGNFLYYKILFAQEYFEAYYYTPILILADGVSCVAQFIGGIMIAKKKTIVNGGTNIIAAVSNILINLIMVKQFGLYAAAISTLLAYIILVVCRIFMIRKYVVLRVNMKSVLTLMISLFAMALVYFNIEWLNILVLVISSIVFIASNRDIIKAVLIKTKLLKVK